MDEFKNIGSLFSEEELGAIEANISFPSGDNNIILLEGYHEMKESLKRAKRILNKHLLLKDSPTEGKFQLPKVLPYTGEIPEVFIPYSAKVCYNSEHKGVYCHIDDSGFNSAWTHPMQALKKVKRYMIAVAPDNTLWVDAPLCENIEQRRRSLMIQRFWQNNGVPTIQVATWGNAESIREFAFDGLAENSWTAIGHQRVGNKSEQRLFRYAVSALIEQKSPKGLINFGPRLDFDPGVPVIIKPSFISKLRKL